MRAYEREAVRRLGRANGRAKVLRELLAYARDLVAVTDARAVSTIGRACGIGQRMVRAHLAALEDAGFLLRVHKAGRRFAAQHGWATSVYVVPALVPFVRAMPPGRRAAAQLALRAPAVAAALANRQGSTDMGSQSPSAPTSVSSASTLPPVSTFPPYPPGELAAVDSDGPARPDGDGGAVAPSPRFAPQASAAAGRELAQPAADAVRPALRREQLAGLPPSAVADVLEGHGYERSAAVTHAAGFARVAAARRARSRRGEAPGRSERHRGPARAAAAELASLREDMRQLAVKHGADPIASAWGRIRGEWARSASGGEWASCRAQLSCRETRPDGAALVVVVEAASAAAEQLARAQLAELAHLARAALDGRPVRVELVEAAP